MKTHIALTKEDKNYTKQEQQEIIREDKEQLKKAKEIENKNKDKVSGLIADAEAYLAAHYKNDYYKKVVDSCAAAKEQRMPSMKEYAKGLRRSIRKHFLSLRIDRKSRMKNMYTRTACMMRR